MKVAIIGASGLVGRFFVDWALGAGHELRILSRETGYQLGDRPDLGGVDLLIHSAFAHVKGRYRGGEGDDPEGFIRANLDGSVALFEAAKSSGVPRVVFLSSRAVYGDYPAGTELTEDLAPRPDTLYGEVKHGAEQALADLSDAAFIGQSLRATGVYGATGQDNKWAEMFKDFAKGITPPPRRATEVHGHDLALSVQALAQAPSGVYNVSDIEIDAHDLLERVAALTGIKTALPERQVAPVSAMTTKRLESYGWRKGGWERLAETLPKLL